MNVFWRQSGRSILFTLLLAILLCLSVVLSCTGFSAWAGAVAQGSAISGSYTTIAVPKTPVVDPLQINPEELGTTLGKKVSAEQAAREAPQLKLMDRRCLLSAYIEGLTPVSSASMDPGEYNEAFENACYSMSVLALKCTKVERDPTEYVMDLTDFEVLETVSLMDAYACFPAPETVSIFSKLCSQDGSHLFEVGKTYLVFGFYHDFRVAPDILGGTGKSYKQVITPHSKRYIIPMPEGQSFRYTDHVSDIRNGTIDGHPYFYAVDGSLPWYTEYTGSVDAFLASDAGTVWREEILPLCQLNHRCAPVMLTDCVTSLYAFNAGNASLLEGRFFTEEEYQDGSPVCLVSAAFAQLNGLKLGDSIHLDYYNPGCMESLSGAMANSELDVPDPGPYYLRYYATPSDSIDFQETYTITGIYTGPRFTFGAYALNADTILVPKASVPGAQAYEMMGYLRLNSIVLDNGSVEAFEQYMESRDLGDQWLYLDQDYTAMRASLKVLEINALRLAWIGVAAFLLVSALFLFLNFRRMKPVIRGARLLGKPAKAISKEVLTTLILTEAAALALGALLSASLFHAVTLPLLSNTLSLQPVAVVLTVAAQAALLFLSSLICSLAAANRPLLQKK